MPRSRGSELPQRQSQRTPLHLKMTVCSEANALPRRPSPAAAADRSSSKLLDDHRRSTRSPLHEIKKRGTKSADLEIKLSEAQEELKKLKDQLNAAESAKLEAEEALEKAKQQIPAITLSHSTDEPEEEQEEEDEIFLEKDETFNGDANEREDKKMEESMKQEQIEESSEVAELKSSLLEKEKEVEFLLEEKLIFKRKAKEEAEKLAASARSEEEELKAELSSAKEELNESRARTEQLERQLEVTQGEKAELELELKRLKVQTEQWRKAAEAAAAVLTGDGDGDGEEGEFGGRRVAERCGSMDQHLLGGGGYVGWSSLVDIEDDAISGGRRKSASGIRRFGDLWKKKGHQK